MIKAYPTDMSNAEWDLIEGMVTVEQRLGRPRSICLRAVVNAIFYLLTTGCQWRMIPHDYPKWQTVYSYFHRWQTDGTWEGMNDKLREWVRVSEQRDVTPSAAVIDSQSVKVGLAGAEAISYDGGKQVKGRKHHRMVFASRISGS